MNPLLKLLVPELASMEPKAAAARFESARQQVFRNRPSLWASLFVSSAVLGLLPLLVLWAAVPSVLQDNAVLRTLAIGLTPVLGLIAWSLLSARAVRPALRVRPKD